MTDTPHHHAVEQHLRQLLRTADLPAPDEVAHLRRAIVFIWYDPKASVLVDLDELPSDGDPLEGLDALELAGDLGAAGFAETA